MTVTGQSSLQVFLLFLIAFLFAARRGRSGRMIKNLARLSFGRNFSNIMSYVSLCQKCHFFFSFNVKFRFYFHCARTNLFSVIGDLSYTFSCPGTIVFCLDQEQWVLVQVYTVFRSPCCFSLLLYLLLCTVSYFRPKMSRTFALSRPAPKSPPYPLLPSLNFQLTIYVICRRLRIIISMLSNGFEHPFAFGFFTEQFKDEFSFFQLNL